MRKKKHRVVLHLPPEFLPFCLGLILLGHMAVFPVVADAAGDVILTTEGSGSVIERDSAHGTHVMKTPEPAPQQEFQGPQTVIVAPAVRYGNQPGYDRQADSGGTSGSTKRPKSIAPRPAAPSSTGLGR